MLVAVVKICLWRPFGPAFAGHWYLTQLYCTQRTVFLKMPIIGGDSERFNWLVCRFLTIEFWIKKNSLPGMQNEEKGFIKDGQSIICSFSYLLLTSETFGVLWPLIIVLKLWINSQNKTSLNKGQVSWPSTDFFIPGGNKRKIHKLFILQLPPCSSSVLLLPVSFPTTQTAKPHIAETRLLSFSLHSPNLRRVAYFLLLWRILIIPDLCKV